MEDMDGFVPAKTAAEASGYSYSMVLKLKRQNNVRSRKWYNRDLVHLQDVMEHKRKQDALGNAKFTPMVYRQEDASDAVAAA